MRKILILALATALSAPAFGAVTLCTETNCQTTKATINGTLYCTLGTETTCDATNAHYATTMSNYCDTSTKKGVINGTVSTQRCVVVTCFENYTANSEKTSCSCQNPCSIGYYGCKKSSTDASGCYSCIPNAYSCSSKTNYVCKQGYYNTGTECLMCPETGLFRDLALTTSVAADTNGPGNGGITRCLVRPGSYYAQEGALQILSGGTACSYTE